MNTAVLSIISLTCFILNVMVMCIRAYAEHVGADWMLKPLSITTLFILVIGVGNLVLIVINL